MSNKQSYLSLLESLRTRIKGYLVFQGAVYIFCSLLLMVFIDLGLDWLFRLDVAQRLLLSLLLAGGLMYIAFKHLLGPMGIELTDENVAVLLENRCPELGDRLISSLQFDRMISQGRNISPLLAKQVQEEAAGLTGKVEVSGLMDGQRLSYLMAIGGVALLLSASAGIAIPQKTWATWAKRNLLFSASAEWPYDTKVTLVGFDPETHTARIPHGEAFILEVRAETERPDGTKYDIPEHVTIRRRIGSGDWVTKTVQGKKGYFRYPLGALFKEVEIVVNADDYTSPTHRIQIASRPDLAEKTLKITPPSYTIGANDPAVRTHSATGTIAVPHGSKVMLSGKSTKPLKEVVIWRGGKKVPGVRLIDNDEFSVELDAETAKAAGNCKVVLIDAEGVTNRSAALFTLVVEPDALPTIRARPVGIGDQITRWAQIPVEIEIKDKYGIGVVRLRYELHRRMRGANAKGPKVVKGIVKIANNKLPGLKRFPRQRQYLDLEKQWELLQMSNPDTPKPVEGDRLRLWVEATDFGGTDRLISFPDQGFHFQIVPDTVLSKALLGKQKRIRRQYAALLEREKTIHWVQLRIKNDSETAFNDAARVAAFFKKHDKNSDQRITPDEFSDPKFKQWDKDKDGALTQSDFDIKWSIDGDTAEQLDKQGTEQRRILRAALRLATALVQIREEMENNRLDRDGRSAAKLKENVIRPMKQLADEQMTTLASALERIARRVGEQPVEEIDKAIELNEEILHKMGEILKQMVWSELFDDVVTRLRTILQLQIELERLTKTEHKKKMETTLPDIFKDDDKKDGDKKDGDDDKKDDDGDDDDKQDGDKEK